MAPDDHAEAGQPRGRQGLRQRPPSRVPATAGNPPHPPGEDRQPGRPLTQRTWWPAIDSASCFDDDGEQQPVPHCPPHSMRHICASWLVQKGVSLHEVQHLLGHESFQTTQRYAHLQPDAHKSVLGAWERMEAPPTVAA
ncbi:tyrosine-type recombinase/integrase [Streptomyces sp. NPDC051041]|uniref:tyrosine-type recombinase/integrase n=1 Tax=Streptomyces sp. NPDC051041 TaxID=3365640 RepID=UPI0037BD8852